jgi:hypothetical protein
MRAKLSIARILSGSHIIELKFIATGLTLLIARHRPTSLLLAPQMTRNMSTVDQHASITRCDECKCCIHYTVAIQS